MADTKDSESKQFGDKYLGKLEGQLNKKAPVFNQSLFSGAGAGTQGAWGSGANLANHIYHAGGYGNGQGAAQESLGGVFSGYGNAGAQSGAQLGQVFGGYGQLGDDNGLTDAQGAAMAGVGGLGSKYAGLGTAYDQSNPAFQLMRQKALDDASKSVGAGFTASGRFGGGSYIDDATEAAVQAIAPLDYQAHQLGVDNKYRSLDSQRGVFGDQFGMGQTGVGNQMGALAGQAGTANSIFGNQMGALGGQGATAGQQFGMGQTALGNQQGAIDSLGQIGAAQDANAQGALLGQADLFDRTKNAELDRLMKIGAAFGDPVAAANQPNWWQSGLGALLGFGGSALSGGVLK
jgi:hypothetical protein